MEIRPPAGEDRLCPCPATRRRRRGLRYGGSFRRRAGKMADDGVVVLRVVAVRGRSAVVDRKAVRGNRDDLLLHRVSASAAVDHRRIRAADQTGPTWIRNRRRVVVAGLVEARDRNTVGSHPVHRHVFHPILHRVYGASTLLLFDRVPRPPLSAVPSA